jgi:LCP family protein required for cell wall assembly
MFTGSGAIARPGPDATFGWPLNLTKRVNILIIGIDVSLSNKRQLLSFARSDSLILVSLDPEHKQINVLSVPRDTRARIPGKGETKINAAYAYGGPRLTIATVRNFLRVPIHYYVKLGSESFARIIDGIGGIEVNVEKDMKYRDWWGDVDINLKKGRQVLDGKHAADYIRFRADAAADIGRVARQQKMLVALFQKLKTPGTLVQAPQLLRVLTQNTQTNLSMGEMVTLGLFVMRLKTADIHTATLPGRVSPMYWEPDMVKVRPLLAEMFYGVDKTVLAATGIEILNASGLPGLARTTAQRLQSLGFHVVRVDSIAPAPDVTSTIIDRSGRPQVVRLLADMLGLRRIHHETGEGADITIILARDQAHRVISGVPAAGR